MCLKEILFQTFRQYVSDRGMSPWRDLVDWVGGLPFEVATPQAVIDFCQKPEGLEPVRQHARSGDYGCNEFVFRRKVETPHLPSAKMKTGS